MQAAGTLEFKSNEEVLIVLSGLQSIVSGPVNDVAELLANVAANDQVFRLAQSLMLAMALKMHLKLSYHVPE